MTHYPILAHITVINRVFHCKREFFSASEFLLQALTRSDFIAMFGIIRESGGDLGGSR
jgi:hypothetical protein